MAIPGLEALFPAHNLAFTTDQSDRRETLCNLTDGAPDRRLPRGPLPLPTYGEREKAHNQASAKRKGPSP